MCGTSDPQSQYESGQLHCREQNGMTLCENQNGCLFSPRPVSRVRKTPGRACVGENTSKGRLGDVFRLPNPASQVTGSTPNEQRFSGKRFPTGTVAAAKDNNSKYGYQFTTITKLVSLGNYYN